MNKKFFVYLALLKEITSLAQAFKGNENEFIEGVQY